VDTGTGKILLRGELPNQDTKILPGMFVRIKVPVKERPNTLLVQDAALNTDLGGKYLLLVNDKNIVERRPIMVGRQIGDFRIVLSGLSGSDRYITKGIQSAFPGSEVIPHLEESKPGPVQNSEKP
jgi:multidrug efflux pump subunit AcrA (membrane-fusion protein)